MGIIGIYLLLLSSLTLLLLFLVKRLVYPSLILQIWYFKYSKELNISSHTVLINAETMEDYIIIIRERKMCSCRWRRRVKLWEIWDYRHYQMTVGKRKQSWSSLNSVRSLYLLVQSSKQSCQGLKSSTTVLFGIFPYMIPRIAENTHMHKNPVAWHVGSVSGV